MTTVGAAAADDDDGPSFTVLGSLRTNAGESNVHPLAILMSNSMKYLHTLSAREWAVFELLSLGYDNRRLARELKISERTVKRHVTSVLSKLGLRSRLQAGLAALMACYFEEAERAVLISRLAHGGADPRSTETGHQHVPSRDQASSTTSAKSERAS